MAGTSAAKLALARGVGAISRLRGGGGTSAPGKLLMRLAPDAIGDLGARLPRGSVLISATNGKTTTAAMAAGILERAGVALVHNHAGANMAGGIATTLLDAARPRGAIAGELGLFEVDELWLASLAAQLHPRAILLGNLFRDQLDRYGELETIAERWAQVLREADAKLVLNADDPLIADLGREHPGRPVLRRARRLAGAARDGARRRRQALPPLRRAVRLRRDLPRPPRPLPLPELRPVPARAGGHRHPTCACRACAPPASRSARPPARPRSRSRCPACTTSTTRSPPPRSPRALEVPLETIVAGLAGARPAFGRAETVTVSVPVPPASVAAEAAGAVAAPPARRELRILLVKNPPAPTRCCARSRSSRASTTCWACSTTTSPTAATCRGSGTPTSSCSRGASGGRPAAARAPPTSPRG